MNYGENFKALRERYGLSQRALANIIGVTRQAYNLYENERVTIPLIHLITLCDYFDVSIDYIFGFTKLKKYNNSYKKVDKIKAGLRLKSWRKENKITQVKLAQTLNTTHSVIADYERGRFLISASFIYTISKTYRVSADFLLGKIDKYVELVLPIKA